jgi:flagellar biosynthesis protein FliQ
MYDEMTLQLVRDTLILVLKVASPILAAGVVVGLIVSIFQSVTSIQDQTLTFVPKIIVMVVVAALLLPWIVARLLGFAHELFSLHVAFMFLSG